MILLLNLQLQDQSILQRKCTKCKKRPSWDNTGLCNHCKWENYLKELDSNKSTYIQKTKSRSKNFNEK
jgi:hypothetical protein